MKLKYLNAYNFCYECARDLILFPVDQKYEMKWNEIQKLWKSSHNFDCGSLKQFFFKETPYITYESQLASADKYLHWYIFSLVSKKYSFMPVLGELKHRPALVMFSTCFWPYTLYKYQIWVFWHCRHATKNSKNQLSFRVQMHLSGFECRNKCAQNFR